MQDLTLIPLLEMFGLDKSRKMKLVRHKSSEYSVQTIIQNKWLELYQSYQKTQIFDKIDTIIAFYGLKGTLSCFYGVYDVLGVEVNAVKPSSDCPWVDEWHQQCPYLYKLQKVTGFEPLEHRLIIDWGNAALAWHQHLTDKTVLEIRAKGRLFDEFPDYLEFSLSYQELKQLIQHAHAHNDWKTSLSAVAGVYLILDETDGKQYIGSAYGSEGIWGRWSQYVNNGHGGNLQLKKLVEEQPDRKGKFRFSILQILPKSTIMKDVIEVEQKYKEKLGSCAFGLNSN